jgi:hypothetical protein
MRRGARLLIGGADLSLLLGLVMYALYAIAT